LEHDCSTARAIGYYLEPLALISLWGKRPLSITLRGITNEEVDCGVDVWRTVTLPLLRQLSGADDFELKVRHLLLRPAACRALSCHRRCIMCRPGSERSWCMEQLLSCPRGDSSAPGFVDVVAWCVQVVRRGAPPGGGGEVLVRLPVVRELPAVSLMDEGMVKRVRGVAHSMRVSPQAANRLVDGARGVLNQARAPMPASVL
jgi:RNA 3'-terminal phosphate cyclase-like protein